MAAEKASGGRGTWEQTSLSSCAESEKPVGEGVQWEIEYTKPQTASGESLAKNVGDVGTKPGDNGVSESPGRGGGNCRLNVLSRMCTLARTRQTFEDMILEFGDSPSPSIIVQSSYG